MYSKLAQFNGDLVELAERAHALSLKPTLPLLYQTTEPIQTEAIYKPLLKDTFPGQWQKCFLSIVWPNGSIMAHADIERKDRIRRHLVIKTNPDCWCMHDGNCQQLEAGGIYEMDEKLTHAAMNWGNDIRMHFVIDIKV